MRNTTPVDAYGMARKPSAATAASGSTRRAASNAGTANTVAATSPPSATSTSEPTGEPVTTRSPSDAASVSVSRSTPPFGFTNIGVGVPRRAERIAACDPRIRLPCVASHATSSGNVALADSRSTSPA